MAEYIDREAALKAIYTSTAPALEVKYIPAADVVKRKTGSWIEDGYYNEPCVCSCCGEPCKDTVMGKPRWIYCPMCGSKNQEAGL